MLLVKFHRSGISPGCSLASSRRREKASDTTNSAVVDVEDDAPRGVPVRHLTYSYCIEIAG